MSVFTRLSDIITANVHALLDRAEDPERMLLQILREMEMGLASAQRHAAQAIAAERRVGRELDRNRTASEHWKQRAREALASERDELARRALARKVEHDDLVRSLERQHLSAVQTSNEVRTTLRALEARLAEARRKQRALAARRQAAKARQELARAIAGSTFDPAASLARFDRIEERMTAFEDEVLAQAELCGKDALDSEFVDLERERQIEEEYAALKEA
jgi:phage shock protein A